MRTFRAAAGKAPPPRREKALGAQEGGRAAKDDPPSPEDSPLIGEHRPPRSLETRERCPPGAVILEVEGAD